MKKKFNLKSIMTKAHKLAKMCEGAYSVCLKMALMTVWKSVKAPKVVKTRTVTKKVKTVEEIRNEMYKSFPYLADDNGVESIDSMLYRVMEALDIADEEEGYSDNYDTKAEFNKAKRQAKAFLKKYMEYKGIDREE